MVTAWSRWSRRVGKCVTQKKSAEWEAIRRRYLSFATSNSTRWHKSTGTSAALNHKNKVAANLSAMFAVLQLYNLGIAALAL